MSEEEPMSNYEERAQKSFNELTDFLSGLGRTLEEGVRTTLQGRGNVLMVRVNDDTLRHVDTLVQAGLFKTRSEAAAYLLHEGIRSKQDIFDRVSATASEISRLRDEMRGTLTGNRPGGTTPSVFEQAFPDVEEETRDVRREEGGPEDRPHPPVV